MSWRDVKPKAKHFQERGGPRQAQILDRAFFDLNDC